MIDKENGEIKITSSKAEEALFMRVLNEIKEITASEGETAQKIEELLQALEEGSHIAGYFEGLKDTLDDDNRAIIIEMFKNNGPSKPRWS